MPSQEIVLPFPLGGVDNRRGYQDSEPQTTRLALNVAPDDSEEARTRGGQRPGLTKRYSNNLGGTPTFMIRVSAGESTRVYEYLVIGTSENIFIGRSVPSGDTYPITYTEQLSALAGELCTEMDTPGGVQTIDTEDGTAGGSQPIIVAEFALQGIDPGLVVQYQNVVIIGSSEDPIQEGTTGTVTGDGATKSTFTDPAGLFVTNGVDPDVHTIDLTSPNEDFPSGTYLIESVDSETQLTLVKNVWGDGSTTSGDVNPWAIRVGVRVLDPEIPSITLLEPTGGFIPAPADAVAVYRDRLVWAVGRIWYMSRQGDPGDYDYAADPEDPSRAIAGSNSEAGLPADPIVAMAPAGFDYLLMFAENSTWNMRGDPGYGGQLFNLSRTVGCVSNNAWTYGDTTEVFHLAKDGLYVVSTDANNPPIPISPPKLPRGLRGIDRDNNYVTLAYDPEDNGVLIFVVPRDGSKPPGGHWLMDVETQSFWPQEFTVNSHQPVDAVSFGGSPQRVRRVVMASLDGFVREWVGPDDDGNAISSYVILGPYALNPQRDIDGLLTELDTVLDLDSTGQLAVEVYIDPESAEGAVDAAIAGTNPTFTAIIGAGRSTTIRPRVRGMAVCLRITAGNRWAMEGIFCHMAPGGKSRR